jgi:hypothetical protein
VHRLEHALFRGPDGANVVVEFLPADAYLIEDVPLNFWWKVADPE